MLLIPSHVIVTRIAVPSQLLPPFLLYSSSLASTDRCKDNARLPHIGRPSAFMSHFAHTSRVPLSSHIMSDSGTL
jgi:hypothetical protein